VRLIDHGITDAAGFVRVVATEGEGDDVLLAACKSPVCTQRIAPVREIRDHIGRACVSFASFAAHSRSHGVFIRFQDPHPLLDSFRTSADALDLTIDQELINRQAAGQPAGIVEYSEDILSWRFALDGFRSRYVDELSAQGDSSEDER